MEQADKSVCFVKQEALNQNLRNCSVLNQPNIIYTTACIKHVEKYSTAPHRAICIRVRKLSANHNFIQFRNALAIRLK